MKNGTCYDPYRSDVAGGGTVFSRVWSGVWSDGAVAAPESIVIEITDRSPSIIPDLACTLGKKNGNTLLWVQWTDHRLYPVFVHGRPDSG